MRACVPARAGHSQLANLRSPAFRPLPPPTHTHIRGPPPPPSTRIPRLASPGGAASSCNWSSCPAPNAAWRLRVWVGGYWLSGGHEGKLIGASSSSNGRVVGDFALHCSGADWQAAHSPAAAGQQLGQVGGCTRPQRRRLQAAVPAVQLAASHSAGLRTALGGCALILPPPPPPVWLPQFNSWRTWGCWTTRTSCSSATTVTTLGTTDCQR